MKIFDYFFFSFSEMSCVDHKLRLVYLVVFLLLLQIMLTDTSSGKILLTDTSSGKIVNNNYSTW